MFKKKDNKEHNRITKLDVLLFAVTALMVGLFVVYMYTQHHSYFTDRSSITTTTVVTDSFGRIDINNATVRQISDITGIGRKLGQSIFDYIKMKEGISSMDELLNVDGIGEAKLDKLCKKFYAGKSPAVTSLSTLTGQSHTTTTSTTPISTTTSVQTTTVTTPKPTNTTTTTTTTHQPQRRSVNINTADADELCRCLLIDYEQANDIVNLRKQISGFTNKLEILYCESISDALYLELEPYLEV